MWKARLHGVPLGIRRLSLYQIPRILLLEELNVNKQDFKGLFTHPTLKQLWFDRGEELIKELNELLIENQINAPSNLQELISLTINKPELNRLYTNSASLYNLQFFFEGLKQSSNHIIKADESEIFRNPNISQVNTNIDDELRNWLVSSFGSLTEFKNLLLNSARAIKGDGITWLITQPNVSESSLRNSFNSSFGESSEPKYTKLSIMNTYNAGIVDDSLRSGQILKSQQQKQAKAALDKEKAADEENIEENIEANILGSVEEAELKYSFSDKKIVPLLAIDASMRNYLLDYGVFGKDQYLDNVWDCINWDVVKNRLPPRFIANFSIE